MAKDRNTFAKRQREAEKKRKRDDKRKRRAQKNIAEEPSVAEGSTDSSLSPGERAVLGVFQKYLMTPGKMLCFSKADLETYDAPLVELTDKGMLVPDKFEGGYSLSESGFAAMTASGQ